MVKILMVTSEVESFAKTGGLADVVPALSKSLVKLGHEVKIVMPRYYSINRDNLKKLDGPLGVPMGGVEEWCAVYTAKIPDTPKDKPVEIYFIDYENYFGRAGFYFDSDKKDYPDNPRRFSFFCRAVFQLCRKIGWYPDILHAHDWQGAMVPVYLKFAERVSGSRGGFEKTASVLTIHNLDYQGIYSKDNFPYMGLGWDVFYNAGFEDWNMLNMLKAGLYSTDKLNTVSPGYAKETQTQALGSKLDGVLRYRSADYCGILNGIDTDIWNPSKDISILEQYRYSAKDMAGKAEAKEALQREFGFPVNADVPVIGMVQRLYGQKGIGELFGPTYGSAYSMCKDMNIQMVVLGSGEEWCEKEIKNLAARKELDKKFKAVIGFSEKLSHLIEAGSDFFLMPSRYEPCGLNQMYSQVYGTLPIVRNTGGLADTVENYNQDTGSGTGFTFDDLTPTAIYDTVKWAVDTWYQRRDHINAMRKRAMGLGYSWEKSAGEYVELYESAREKV